MEAAILYQITDFKSNNSLNETISNDDTTMTILYGMDFILIGIAFLFNKIGIVLLMKAKTCGISNQNMLLVHLSVVSILCLCLNSAAVFWKCNHIRFPHWYIILFYIVYIAYISNLVAMTIDRLLFVLLRMKYCVVVTKMVVFTMLIITWVVAITYGLAYNMFNNLTVRDRENASYAYNGFVILFAVLVFIIIEINMHRLPQEACCFSHCSKTHRNGQESKSQPIRKQKIKRRKYMLSFVILLTFFLVATVPSFIAEHFEKDSREFEVFVVAFIGVNVSNYIIVPLTYVFLQPKVRTLLHAFLMRMKSVIYKTLSNNQDSQEKERLLVKSIYDGTNPTYGTIA